MSSRRKVLSERNIQIAFEISLILKGLFALSEVIAGVSAYLLTQHFIVGAIQFLTRAELSEDPRDFVANYLLNAAQHLSISTQHFTAMYLLGHGVVKLWLVIGLMRRKLWYYPVASTVFGIFIVYQLYRFTFTDSIWLLVISAVDAIVIALTRHEYKLIRRAE